MRRPLRSSTPARGFTLIVFLSLVVAGVLAFLIATLGPEAMEAWRKHKTEKALAEAREALLGYATRYRDSIDTTSVYGYLPLPDLGSSRNNNLGCTEEGCDAGNFGGNGDDITVIGRFPWRLMGTEPLRDGNGDCLWYAVSNSHKRIQPGAPDMNWDAIGQLDIVVANGTTALATLAASAHDRPVAIIFSPGPLLPNQDRATPTAYPNDVTQCGGNYDVANYLDPDTAGALGGVTNYFGGSTNNASDDTNPTPKAIASQGPIFKASDSKLWPNTCPSGDSCALASNDRGLALTPDALFAAIRKSSGFRTDINSMIDRMVGCLQDSFANSEPFAPKIITGFSSPADKSAGRVPNRSCYDDSKAPINYFSHWQDMFFIAKPTSGNFTVSTTLDGSTYTTNNSCAGVLILAGQRGTKIPAPTDPQESVLQLRTAVDVSATNTTLNTDWLPNFIEDESPIEPTNLSHFTGTGTTFKGAELLDIISSTQSASRDIVRCIPNTSSMATSSPQDLVDDDDNDLSPLASYDAGSRTLTLGSENATRGNGVAVNQLYGCAWTPEVNIRGNGFRTYFSFQFMGITGGVGNNGFVFATIDGNINTTSVCGAAGSHLGYSGNNGVTPPLAFPKIGIEFDQQRNYVNLPPNFGFSESTDLAASNPGRKDPCGTTPGEPIPPDCAPPYVGYNSHSAIVYWGHENTNAADGVTRPQDDDNVHGYPSVGSQGANPRPAPQNPEVSSSGVAFKDYRAKTDVDGDSQADSWLYHVRVEVMPTRNVNSSAAELSSTGFVTKVWIERGNDTDPIIVAMKNTTRPMAQLNPITPTLSDAATIYDVRGAACGTGESCSAGYTCGTDNYCYRPGLKSVRLGFTNSQRTQDQRVIIRDFFTSWLP